MWPVQPAGGHARWCSPGVPLSDPVGGTSQRVLRITWPWPAGWDQTALANTFSTMALTPLVGPEWVADSGATYHTTPNPGILSSVHPPPFSLPSSIMVANGSFFLSHLWMPPAPMALFVFLTFLLLLLWFTTFFQFVVL